MRPPFVARVAAGLALTLVEETRRLPTTAVALPMTSVSLLLQTSMRVQQTFTGLAIKGDQALSFMYPAREQPEWATFDEDLAPADAEVAAASERGGEAGGIGRFALYSTPIAAVESVVAPAGAPSTGDAGKPAIAESLSFDTITLAQLRSRLRNLSADELDELLAYERAGSARSPYLTMLENRIASLSGK